MSQHIQQFKNILGESYVLHDASSLEAYGRDWTKNYDPNPLAIVFPGNTKEVSEVLRYCYDHNLAIVPSGGRTGLAGGAVATQQEVVLSLNRLNKIELIDSAGLTVKVQAGVTTQALQEAAQEQGLFFPIDLAAKGTSQIGGNIATNAGGVKLIRYGGMREQVLGLEVVLPDGSILDLNTALRKNNTGYDLKQLFIGSEGTLGVITSATLKLMPPPRGVHVSIMAVDSFEKIPQVLTTCNKLRLTVTAFEFFTKEAHSLVLQHAVNARSPFPEMYPYYVLLEGEDESNDGERIQSLLEQLFENELILDAVIANSSAQFKEFWGLRENITESIAAHGHVRKNDISLAIHQLDAFIADLQKLLTTAPKDILLVLFGHIGDGNLHINYVGSRDKDFKTFHAEARALEERIFKVLASYKGSISAEHGIGLLKKKDLELSKDPAELNFMRALKKVFDPKGLMNPGKIFD